MRFSSKTEFHSIVSDSNTSSNVKIIPRRISSNSLFTLISERFAAFFSRGKSWAEIEEQCLRITQKSARMYNKNACNSLFMYVIQIDNTEVLILCWTWCVKCGLGYTNIIALLKYMGQSECVHI